jgi:uncharacterized protein (DUF4415 family)
MPKKKDSRGETRKTAKAKPGKTKLWLWIDKDIVKWFEARTQEAGRKRYDKVMNDAMRWHIDSPEGYAFRTGKKKPKKTMW